MGSPVAWSAGVARPVRLVRRRRPPSIPDPVVLDHRLTVDAALQVLGSLEQAIAFVSGRRGRCGVVTAEDLRFAREWAGPGATVAQAVTQDLVDLEPDELTARASWQQGGRR